MTVFGIPIRELIVGLVAMFTAVFVAWSKIREMRLVKDKGLLPNPERCEQHGLAIAEIKTEITNIKDDLKEIKDRLHNAGA
jgi:hypothetical protein